MEIVLKYLRVCLQTGLSWYCSQMVWTNPKQSQPGRASEWIIIVSPYLTIGEWMVPAGHSCETVRTLLAPLQFSMWLGVMFQGVGVGVGVSSPLFIMNKLQTWAVILFSWQPVLSLFADGWEYLPHIWYSHSPSLSFSWNIRTYCRQSLNRRWTSPKLSWGLFMTNMCYILWKQASLMSAAGLYK